MEDKTRVEKDEGCVQKEVSVIALFYVYVAHAVCE